MSFMWSNHHTPSSSSADFIVSFLDCRPFFNDDDCHSYNGTSAEEYKSLGNQTAVTKKGIPDEA